MIGPDESVAIMGMKGTGKTTLCRVIARAAAPRVVVWDPLSQFPVEVSYRPRALSSAEFDELARRCWHAAPMMLVVSEAEQVIPQRGGVLPPAFQALALMGRNLGLRYVAETRQPQRLDKAVLDQADPTFIFKLAGRALEYMEEYLGRHDGRQLEVMRSWTKDPREGGGRFFYYRDGELREHSPLSVPPSLAS